jgi:hypothetical protein
MNTLTVKPLFKTTIVIWTEYDPSGLELTELASQAESGDGYCSRMTSALVARPEKDPAWDRTRFFDLWSDLR